LLFIVTFVGLFLQANLSYQTNVVRKLVVLKWRKIETWFETNLIQ